jgi:hypothetical protein
MDISDLGRKVKAKYPGVYDDLPDAEVGRRVRAKYPEYSDFENEPIKAEAKRPLFTMLAYLSWVAVVYCLLAEGNIGKRIAWAITFLIAGYIFKHLAGSAYKEEATELTDKTDIKQRQAMYKEALIREPHISENVRVKMLLEKIQQKNEQRKLELERHLIDVAEENGLTPLEVVEVNKEKYLSEIRLAEREGTIHQDIRRQRELSEIEVRKHRELTNIDLEKRWKEIEQDLDAGDLLDLSDQQLIRKQTEHLEEMYRRRHELLHGPDPEEVKVYLLARYDKNIAHLEAKIDARQAGLLLPENGQKAKGLKAATEGGADYPAAIDPDDI